MGIVAIITLIIQALNFIMGLFQDGLPFGINNLEFTRAYQQAEYSCSSLYWSVPPRISDGHFIGTVDGDCELEGLTGEGIPALRAHLINQIPQDMQEIHAGPIAGSYEGLPSSNYDATLVRISNGEPVHIRGNTYIAGDDNRIKNVFESSSISADGSGKYVKHMNARADIEATDISNWYRLQSSQVLKVKKPSGMSSRSFKAQMIEEAEKALRDKLDHIVDDMAAHL